MTTDDDVRRFLDRMACEPNANAVDPAPVIARAYRRLARTTSVLGMAGVTLVAATVLAGPSLFQASPAPGTPAAPAVHAAAAVVATARTAHVTCLGDGRSHLEPTTVALQPDGLLVAIIQQHTGRRSQVFIRVSGWMTSVGFSSPDRTRFRTVGVDESYDHVAIGCFESLADWPPPPERSTASRSSLPDRRGRSRASHRASASVSFDVGVEAAPRGCRSANPLATERVDPRAEVKQRAE